MNAIVTGATKGIGRALVFGLLKEGWNVAVTSRNMDDLKLLQEECHQHHDDERADANIIHLAHGLFPVHPHVLRPGKDLEHPLQETA